MCQALNLDQGFVPQKQMEQNICWLGTVGYVWRHFYCHHWGVGVGTTGV